MCNWGDTHQEGKTAHGLGKYICKSYFWYALYQDSYNQEKDNPIKNEQRIYVDISLKIQ